MKNAVITITVTAEPINAWIVNKDSGHVIQRGSQGLFQAYVNEIYDDDIVTRMIGNFSTLREAILWVQTFPIHRDTEPSPAAK